jgi:hypothetical protein
MTYAGRRRRAKSGAGLYPLFTRRSRTALPVHPCVPGASAAAGKRRGSMWFKRAVRSVARRRARALHRPYRLRRIVPGGRSRHRRDDLGARPVLLSHRHPVAGRGHHPRPLHRLAAALFCFSIKGASRRRASAWTPGITQGRPGATVTQLHARAVRLPAPRVALAHQSTGQKSPTRGATTRRTRSAVRCQLPAPRGTPQSRPARAARSGGCP